MSIISTSQFHVDKRGFVTFQELWNGVLHKDTSTLQDKQIKWSFYRFTATGSKLEQKSTTPTSFLFFKTDKINVINHFIGFYQLVLKLERITLIISILQDK